MEEVKQQSLDKPSNKVVVKNTNKKTLSKFILSAEVFTTVFALIVLFWQFILSISINEESKLVQSTRTYQFIINYLIDFEMVSQVKTANLTKGEDCTNGFLPYKFKTLEGINNVCIEKKEGKSILRFEKECKDKITYDKPRFMSNIGEIKLCYKTFPKSNYVYTFRSINRRCDDNQMMCGFTNKLTICLNKNEFVENCPAVEIWFYRTTAAVPPNFYQISEKINEISKFMTFTNFTTSVWPFLSFKMSFESFNDINYYKYRKTYGYLHNQDSEILFSSYYNDYDGNDNIFSVNPFYSGKVSDYVDSQLEWKSVKFLQSYDLTGDPDIIPFYQTLDPNLEIRMSITYLSLPREDCIQHLFIDNLENNSRGYFKVMSDISFKFFNLNLMYYITWNFIQACTLSIYSLIYRINIIKDKINNLLKEADKKYEKITIFTLKLLYYLSLAMKLLILYNLNNYAVDKVSFITYLVEYGCFEKYFPLDNRGDSSLLHLNLRLFLNEPSLAILANKANLIFNITFVELSNEVVSLIFYAVITVFNI